MESFKNKPQPVLNSLQSVSPEQALYDLILYTYLHNFSLDLFRQKH